MSERHRGNNKQPPWERDADAESVSFGPWLRRQREMREITLREISDASKISLRYLQALEEERFDILPAPVFAKGFLRQYARYVGLDPDEVVNRFLVASDAEAPEEEAEEPELATERRGAFDGAWRYALLVIAVAALLLALLFLIPLLFGDEDEVAGRQPPPGVAPPEAAAPVPAAGWVEGAQAQGPHGARAPDAGDTGDAGPSAPLRVALDFQGDCWIEASVDGEVEVSEMRVQGESLQLRAERGVELRLGDAGVVTIEVNGEPFPLDASPGEVRRVQIDLSDLPGGLTPATPGEAGSGAVAAGSSGEPVAPAGPAPRP